MINEMCFGGYLWEAVDSLALIEEYTSGARWWINFWLVQPKPQSI